MPDQLKLYTWTVPAPSDSDAAPRQVRFYALAVSIEQARAFVINHLQVQLWGATDAISRAAFEFIRCAINASIPEAMEPTAGYLGVGPA